MWVFPECINQRSCYGLLSAQGMGTAGFVVNCSQESCSGCVLSLSIREVIGSK